MDSISFFRKAFNALAGKADLPDPGMFLSGTGVIPTYPLTWPGWDKLGASAQDEQNVRRAVNSAWVFSDISEIARLFSAAELSVVDSENEKVDDHPLQKIWDAPNPHMGQTFLMQFWCMQRLLYGKSFLFFSPGVGGELAEIWPVPANMIRPKVDKEKFISAYEFKPKPDAKPQIIPAEYIVYSRLPHPFNLSDGLSPLAAILTAINTDRAQSKWNLDFFAKDHAIVPSVISTKTEMRQSDFERFKAEIYEYFGSGQRRTLVTRGGDVDVKLLGVSRRDIDFIEGRHLSRDEIDRGFGFPEGYWAMLANKATAQHAMAVLIGNTVWPTLVALAEDLNAQAMPAWGWEDQRVRFSDIRPRDRELAIREARTRRAYWTVNELRRLDGQEPLDDPVWDEAPADAALKIYAAGSTGAAQAEEQPFLASVAYIADLEKWCRKAEKHLKETGSALCEFAPPHAIPDDKAFAIKAQLETARTPEEVRAIFKPDPFCAYP